MVAPVLTQYLDANPVPRVEVFFPSLPGASTVTVFRVAEGRTEQVRGAVRAVTAGALSRIDSEVPFGVPVSYFAELFDGAGLSLGVTEKASVTVWVDDTWVHNPLNPAGGVRVAFRPQAVRELSRPVSGQVVYPLGRRVGVIIGSERKGLAGVNLDVVTDTVEDADLVQDLLGSESGQLPPVLCFRIGASDRIRIPRTLFVGVLDIVERDRNYVLGGEQIDHAITGDEVAPPLPGLFIPLLTRADVNVYYATRAAVAADNSSRGDVNRKYEIAGTA